MPSGVRPRSQSKRIYIHESLYDRFATAMVDYARTVKVGDGTEPGIQPEPPAI